MRNPVSAIIKLLATLTLSGAVLLVIFVVLIGRERALEMVFGAIEPKSVDFTLLKLAPTPNQFLVCPKSFCATVPHLVSPLFDLPATDLRDRWMVMMERQPRIEIGTNRGAETISDTGANQVLQYDFIQRSELMRYPDSITVRFIPLSAETSGLAIYSRSHYGKSDFGVNEARIRSWLKQIEQ